MKIVADENIPFVEALFSRIGEVHCYPGRHIEAKHVADANILLVRSVTPVNERLLGNSSVEFVGTCTIGTDHLDTEYLNARGITWSSAPGCNADAVVQYVLSAMASLKFFSAESRDEKKVGIVGCGNVGGRLHRVLKALQYECLCYDPFLSDADNSDLTELQQVLKCDFVSVHTPLTHTGTHPTFELFNKLRLEEMKDGATLLNAGRGEVVSNSDLLQVLTSGKPLQTVLDVWEAEPDVNRELLHHVDIASPHIAGYSFEGRVKGSQMIFEALADYLGLGSEQLNKVNSYLQNEVLGAPVELTAKSLDEFILATYDIKIDDKGLRDVVQQLPNVFDKLRKNYLKRREFSHYRPHSVDAALACSLLAVGFATPQ